MNVPSPALWLLRSLALLHALVVVLQPVLAGSYLGGNFDALGLHSANAGIVLVTEMALSAGIVAFWAARGAVWPLAVGFALFFAEGLQVGMGYSRQLAVHIPLGVAIVCTVVLFTVWTFRSTARRARKDYWGVV